MSDPEPATIDQKTLIERFYTEVWDRGNVDLALEVFHDDYIR